MNRFMKRATRNQRSEHKGCRIQGVSMKRRSCTGTKLIILLQIMHGGFYKTLGFLTIDKR